MSPSSSSVPPPRSGGDPRPGSLRPPSSAPDPSRRPRKLVVVLILLLVIGLLGSFEGCHVIEILRDPAAVRASASTRLSPEMLQTSEALIDALVASRRVTAPLAAAEFILGSLLSLAASAALARGFGRMLLVQAIIAYGLFLPVDYVLKRPVRAAQIEATMLNPRLREIRDVPHPELLSRLRSLEWTIARGALGAQLIVLGLGLFMLTGPRARAWPQPPQDDERGDDDE